MQDWVMVEAIGEGTTRTVTPSPSSRDSRTECTGVVVAAPFVLLSLARLGTYSMLMNLSNLHHNGP